MTRIIAGSAKGRSLQVPRKGTRPTSDKVRGAIFSRLQAWDAVEGARVLDLYAGSGALALEALSRGAADATLVEKSAAAARVIRLNAEAAGVADHASVKVRGVEAYLRGISEPVTFDLVFLDPPYRLAEAELTTALQLLTPHLSPGAVVVVERDARSPEPVWPQSSGLTRIDSKTWGDTRAWFLEAEPRMTP